MSTSSSAALTTHIFYYHRSVRCLSDPYRVSRHDRTRGAAPPYSRGAQRDGRLVVVGPMHDSSRGLARDKHVAQHDIAIEIVDEELRAAGFEVVERDASFIKFTGVPAGSGWLWAAACDELEV